jgi:hypothetical protein
MSTEEQPPEPATPRQHVEGNARLYALALLSLIAVCAVVTAYSVWEIAFGGRHGKVHSVDAVVRQDGYSRPIKVEVAR